MEEKCRNIAHIVGAEWTVMKMLGDELYNCIYCLYYHNGFCSAKQIRLDKNLPCVYYTVKRRCDENAVNEKGSRSH